MNFKALILKGDTRTVKANKNTIVSAFIKGADMLVYLLLVPLTLGYLNSYEYGIWLTLNSMLVWINSFDIGLGNGLRNKLALSIAEGDKDKSRAYVSTTFYMLLVVITVVYIILAIVVNNINWYNLLNVSLEYTGNLVEIVQVSLLFFCINFVLKFIGNVYQALQLPAVSNLMVFCGNLLALVVIFLFTRFVVPGNLFWVAAIYSVAPPFVHLIAYPITFKKIFPFLAPTIKLFKKEYLKDLLSLSIVFFALQIASVVLFSLSNLLISNMFTPEYVTPYNITYRYFSIVAMLFNLFITPMWSAATDAFAKGDIEWIKASHRRMKFLLMMFLVLLFIMTFVSKWMFQLWIGNEIQIPFLLSVIMALYIAILIYSLGYSYFLNGIGRLRLQMIFTFTAAVCFYPLCSSLGHIYGIVGIVAGMCIINIPGLIVNIIQFNRVINGNDTGIWSL